MLPTADLGAEAGAHLVDELHLALHLQVLLLAHNGLVRLLVEHLREAIGPIIEGVECQNHSLDGEMTHGATAARAAQAKKETVKTRYNA